MKLITHSLIKKRQEEARFQVMFILQKNPDISQRELAVKLGLSLGSVNYVLRALVAKGLVKAQNFSSSKKKLVYVYVLTPRGIAEKTRLTANFLKRKLEDYQALKLEIEALKHSLEGQRQSPLVFDNEY
jgi:EPS-associated MarR family transcriptional regulator